MVASPLLQASHGDPNTQYLSPWAAPECTVVNMNIVCTHMDVRSMTDSFYTSMPMFFVFFGGSIGACPWSVLKVDLVSSHPDWLISAPASS